LRKAGHCAVAGGTPCDDSCRQSRPRSAAAAGRFYCRRLFAGDGDQDALSWPSAILTERRWNNARPPPLGPSILGDAVAHYVRHGAERPAVAFCVSVRHAEEVVAAFRATCWRAEGVSAVVSLAERNGAIAGLTNDVVQARCVCDLISERPDVPAIGVAVLLRRAKWRPPAHQARGTIGRSEWPACACALRGAPAWIAGKAPAPCGHMSPLPRASALEVFAGRQTHDESSRVHGGTQGESRFYGSPEPIPRGRVGHTSVKTTEMCTRFLKGDSAQRRYSRDRALFGSLPPADEPAQTAAQQAAA